MRGVLLALAGVVLLAAAPIRAADADSVEELTKLYEAGRYGVLVERGLALLESRPGDAELRLLLGRALADSERFAEAEPHLREALERDVPPSWITAWAWNYLGRAAFAAGDAARAKESFGKSIAAGTARGAAESSERYLGLCGLSPAYFLWEAVPTEHFRFHFGPGTRVADRQAYAAEREAAFPKIAAFFGGCRLPKPIDFFTWNGPDDSGQAGIQPGFAAPELCIVHASYEQTVGHEMAHVIMHQAVKPRVKTALVNEGFAVMSDQTGEDKLERARKMIARRGIQTVSIRELWAKWEALPPEVAYPLAGAFAAHLVERGGREAYVRLLGDQTPERAAAIYGGRLDGLIAGFERRLAGLPEKAAAVPGEGASAADEEPSEEAGEESEPDFDSDADIEAEIEAELKKHGL